MRASTPSGLSIFSATDSRLSVTTSTSTPISFHAEKTASKRGPERSRVVGVTMTCNRSGAPSVAVASSSRASSFGRTGRRRPGSWPINPGEMRQTAGSALPPDVCQMMSRTRRTRERARRTAAFRAIGPVWQLNTTMLVFCPVISTTRP